VDGATEEDPKSKLSSSLLSVLEREVPEVPLEPDELTE